MRAHTKKAEPMSLHDLLEMRKQLRTRLEAKRGAGVPDADWLQEVYQRCNDAITRARIDQSISSTRTGG